jgi:hypothetical protein
LRFFSLNLLQIFYSNLHPLRLQEKGYVTSREPPVRPVMRTSQTGAPLRKSFWASEEDFHPNLFICLGYEIDSWYWSNNHQFLEKWRIIQFIRKFLILPRKRDK